MYHLRKIFLDVKLFVLSSFIWIGNFFLPSKPNKNNLYEEPLIEKIQGLEKGNLESNGENSTRQKEDTWLELGPLKSAEKTSLETIEDVRKREFDENPFLYDMKHGTQNYDILTLSEKIFLDNSVNIPIPKLKLLVHRFIADYRANSDVIEIIKKGIMPKLSFDQNQSETSLEVFYSRCQKLINDYCSTEKEQNYFNTIYPTNRLNVGFATKYSFK